MGQMSVLTYQALVRCSCRNTKMSLVLDDLRESKCLSSQKTKMKFEQNVFKFYDVQNAYCIRLAHVLQTLRRKGDNVLSEKILLIYYIFYTSHQRQKLNGYGRIFSDKS